MNTIWVARPSSASSAVSSDGVSPPGQSLGETPPELAGGTPGGTPALRAVDSSPVHRREAED
jgi:hypothetical protein